MKRKASLAECGFEEEEIEESLAAYDALDDEAFDRIIALQMNRMVKNKKKMEEEKDAEAAMPPALKEALEKKKKKESEAAADEAEAEEAEAADESVLDEVEVEEEVNLSVGSDNESEEDSTQAALVEFVRSRLTHK